MITDIFGRAIMEKVTRDEKGVSLLEMPNSFVVFDIETTGLDFIFDEIIEKYSDKTVLIVSHGGVCRVIETYFNDMTKEEFSGWFMGNCQLIEYNTRRSV